MEVADARRVRSLEDLDDLTRHAPPPTTDDVSIAMDGRRLDTKEKALAFLAEIEAERAAGPEGLGPTAAGRSVLSSLDRLRAA
ncbi:MAG: hypothetical protein M3083_24220 [Actinomycetota bacterium]|nr:hypothetical protein [Actinomycetota bacterium]MDQ6948920.1 hypothetical protein [Actinomycetota bacterium]